MSFLTADRRSKGGRSLLELLEELGRLEVLGDLLVEALDDLVDLLLPARLCVLAVAHGHEELAQRRLDHGQKVRRNLQEEEENIEGQSSKLLRDIEMRW